MIKKPQSGWPWPIIIGDTPLMKAIDYDQENIIEYLLSLREVDIDKQDFRKRNALMCAVIKDNHFALNKIMKENSDFLKTDINGDTVLHLAVVFNPDLVKTLILIPQIKDLLQIKNIYGETPLDLAIQHKKDLVISLLAPDADRNRIRKDKRYGNLPVRINQAAVNNAMYYRLKLKYRNTEYFPLDGQCNGYVFLKSFYAARQMNAYYFSTLALMSSWHGDEAALEKKFYIGEKPTTAEIENISQAQYYKNLDELFEQWTNDIIWFQHSNTLKIDSLSQEDRVQQYQLVKDKDDYEYCFLNDVPEKFSVDIHDAEDYHQFEARLTELLQYFVKMPKNVYFELGGSEHATCAYINSHNLFDYYDPNFAFETEITKELNKIVRRIIDYKYIVLVDSTPCNYKIEIRLFCFKKDFPSLGFEQFEIFDRSMLPESKGDAIRFQYQSPNKFTPLHVAVLTKSLPCIKQLLRDGYCRIDAKDKEGRTSFAIALDNNFYEAMELIIQSYGRNSLEIDYALVDIYYHNKTEILQRLLANLSEIKIPELFFKALAKKDLELIKIIHGKGLIDLNESYSREVPLILAMKANNVEMVEYFLKSKASVLVGMKSLFAQSTPLRLAMMPDSPYFELILANLADINQRDVTNSTALQHAISFLNVDAMQKLIAKGASLQLLSADMDILDFLYKSFEENHFSIMYNRPQYFQFRNDKIQFLECLKLILPALNLNPYKDEDNKKLSTLLKKIVISKRFDGVKSFALALQLFDKNTLNATVFEDLKLLPYILGMDEYDKLEPALIAGADIDAVFPSGNTCLMGLVKIKDMPEKYDLINLLLKYKPNLDIKNEEGKTVMDLLQESSDEKITEIFREQQLLPAKLTRNLK